jgi:hypothetical protein
VTLSARCNNGSVQHPAQDGRRIGVRVDGDGTSRPRGRLVSGAGRDQAAQVAPQRPAAGRLDADHRRRALCERSGYPTRFGRGQLQQNAPLAATSPGLSPARKLGPRAGGGCKVGDLMLECALCNSRRHSNANAKSPSLAHRSAMIRLKMSRQRAYCVAIIAVSSPIPALGDFCRGGLDDHRSGAGTNLSIRRG